MRYLVLLLLLLAGRASGQYLFFAHNHTTATAPSGGPVCTAPNTGYAAPAVTTGLWADFSPLAGVTLTNCRVTAWTDAVGGRTLTATADTLNQPELTNAGGEYGVFFDNYAANGPDYLTGTWTLAQPFTIVALTATARGPAAYGMLWSNQEQTLYYGYSSTGMEAHAGSAYATWSGGTGRLLQSVVYNTTTSTVYEGTAVKYTGAMGSAGFTSFRLGAWFNASYPVRGHVYRLLIYNRALSAAEIETLHNSFLPL
jgi:hypothetical protein